MARMSESASCASSPDPLGKLSRDQPSQLFLLVLTLSVLSTNRMRTSGSGTATPDLGFAAVETPARRIYRHFMLRFPKIAQAIADISRAMWAKRRSGLAKFKEADLPGY
ncbi:hypothetical protein D9757_000217 [Collybiopsis confluens]|uniref:Uncharacterized protein n=1 Tax=Collybiopsis confluens TaxID=2823264 RepID=A0A8H5I2Y4_9AGAR|nr:hypothetical protein D9757_000217 [Collybiopsis confluens]